MQDSCAPPKPIFKSPHTEINKHRNLVGLFASHCTLLYGGFRNLKKKKKKRFSYKFNSKDKFWTIYSLFPWKLLVSMFRIKWDPSNSVVVQCCISYHS